jgi:hypothetical protein
MSWIYLFLNLIDLVPEQLQQLRQSHRSEPGGRHVYRQATDNVSPERRNRHRYS